MNCFSAARQRVTRVLGITVIASLLSVLAASAQTGTSGVTEPTPAPIPPQTTMQPPTAPQSQEAWGNALTRVPLPKRGCFTSSYPRLEWLEVPCTPPSPYPNPPARGPSPNTVGNGNDFQAQSSGLISTATGSFNSVSSGSSESGDVGGNSPPVANAFTLQLNSQFFSNSPACQGVQGCQGWQQFIFSQTQCGGQPCVFMEYWLLNFGPTCPQGQPWISAPPNCWFNGPSTPVSPQTTGQLAGLTLTGTASGGQDTVVLTTANGNPTAVGQDSVLSLQQFWNTAEFNIFGDCCLSQANFNLGSTLVVKTSIVDGTMNAPACVPGGTTGETNNLVLEGTCSTNGGASPAIVFTESFVGPPAASGPFVNVYSGHDQQHFAYLAKNVNGRNGEIWDLFYCPGCSDQVWQLQKINDGGVTKGPPAASAPSVNVYSGHDQQHFAYLATNPTGANIGEIWDAFYCPGCSGNKWQLQKINGGGVTNGPPAVSAPFVDTYAEADQQHFAYLATNGEIWDAFYCPGCSGDKWQLQKINSGGVTNGPPAASAPFVNVFSGHDQQHFSYRAVNGDIWDAFYCPGCSGNKWKLQKINSGGVTNGPPAISAPFVDTYAEADQQHFAYLAVNGEIWDAFYCPGCSGDKWQLQKINSGGVTNGPPAASSSFVNVYSGHDQQHFAYLAINTFAVTGDIWDAYYCPGCSGNKWQLQKINGGGGVTNGPPAVSGPFVDTYAEADQQHFAYLAGNGEIWDAFYCPGCSGNKWQLQRLAGQ
jgi:rubredoxin